jgi:dihydroceramide fatty acyl 2-hydroxylase
VTTLAGLQLVALATAGFYSWGFVEYAIHGFLSHRWNTPVSPLHWAHHREPRAVFTAPMAWVPAALLAFGLITALIGATLSGAYVLGLLVGFARYERVHWQIHFRQPRNARERRLREHHLAHHFRNPSQYHGVTTHRWDRIFGTLPELREADYAAVSDYPVLEGASNLVEIWKPSTAWARIREARSGTQT